jgi:hypothetical protein
MTGKHQIRARNVPPAVAGPPPAYPAPGSDIPPERNSGRPGYVVGLCPHPVLRSEWLAGFRTCEPCGTR